MSIGLSIFSSPALLQTFRLFPSIPHAVDKHSVTEKLREPTLAKASAHGVFQVLISLYSIRRKIFPPHFSQIIPSAAKISEDRCDIRQT